MKTLTVKQPWASLLVEGIKGIENRTWTTKHRGWLLIHAGVSIDSKERSDLEWHLRPLTMKQFMHCDETKLGSYSVGYGLIHLLPRMSIIGAIEIVDCVINHQNVWADHEHQASEFDGIKTVYSWVVGRVVKFDYPVTEVKGKLSLWDFPLDQTRLSEIPQ
jgi:ASCH domain-containing protein